MKNALYAVGAAITVISLAIMVVCAYLLIWDIVDMEMVRKIGLTCAVNIILVFCSVNFLDHDGACPAADPQTGPTSNQEE